MAFALILLNKLDQANDIIKQGEELLKTIPQEVPTDYKQRNATLVYLKGFLSEKNDDINGALEHYEHSLALREELGINHQIAQSLNEMVLLLCLYKGDLDLALKYAERSLALAKESTKKFYIANSLVMLAAVYVYRGDLDRCIILFEQVLAIYKELNNKRMIAITLNNVGEKYRMKGELDRALECLEQSLALHQELGNLGNIAGVHDYLIQILIDKGDLERAQQYLHDLEQLNNKLKDKEINIGYLFDKALILKTSLRARNRGKAEEIFNQLLEDKDLKLELTIRALLNLCELLLIELRMINDVEVLDEINPLIVRLLDIAEKSHSYWILSETYLLQAKLSLLTFDIKKA
ncbi:MAG: tetratricopeptide repeat protein, partial [Candidatus Lokiarchaeota archaeon]|nr:tetratricopeptide repeat protein [Candidatus Lokiarchaeota archaeon]